MNYESKYYNLESIPEGWSKEEFILVIEILESLQKEPLLDLLNKFNIKFSIGEEKTKLLDEEELINTIISDAPREKLIEELKKLK